jgi:hypothetical protein
MGRFSSAPVDTNLDPVLHRSHLAIVWFQDSVAIPGGGNIPAALRDVRWEERAQDEEV